MNVIVRAGRVVDPANAVDTRTTVYVADGRIAALGDAPAGFTAHTELDATDMLVCPGLVDLSARLREPGAEHKGTIASETRAAALGGITTLCCWPDTDPVIDEPATVELINRRAADAGFSKVLPLGALTQGLGGEYLAEMVALKRAGCVAVSNAWQAVPNTRVLRRSLEYAATHELPVFLQALDPWLAAEGCAHEGPVATRLGLPGIPVCAETVALAELLELVAATGVRAHFSQLSTARSLAMLRAARDGGARVSADVSINNLMLCEHDLSGFDARCHVRPPLRSEDDRQALREALRDGVLDAVCSDHQPHEPDAKLAPFAATAPGISGFDTLLGLMLKLVDEEVLGLGRAIEALTAGPAAVLGLQAGQLAVGAAADLCIIDPGDRAEVVAEDFASRGRNTPYSGWQLPGRVKTVLIDGQPVAETQ